MRFLMPYFYFLKTAHLKARKIHARLISQVNNTTVEIQPRTELIQSYPLQINKINTTVLS